MESAASTTCVALARHVHGMRTRELGHSVQERTRLLILDNLGCMLAGACTDAGRRTLQGFIHFGGQAGGGRIVGAPNYRAAPMIAAAIAGMNANALDYDDTLYGHPGSVLIPTALTLAEHVGATGAQLAAAVTAGYEAASRLSVACMPSASTRKLIWGIGSRHAPAAAVVAAHLLGLSEAETANAIAIAAINSPVASITKTLYSELGPTMAKNNFAMSAIAGISGATLAQAGFDGPLDVFDGDNGWWRMIGSDTWTPAPSLTNFDGYEEVLKVEFKPYPCCRFIHSAIEAVLRIAAEHALDPANIQRVDVRTYSWITQGAFAERRPRDMPAAQFSIPYCAAVALSGHPPGPDWYAAEVLEDAGVLDLAAKVRLIPWPEADALHVEQWLAQVTVVTAGGSIERTIAYPLGHPRNPVSRDHIEAKFDTLVAPLLGADATRALRQRIATLQEQEDLSGLFALIHAGRPASHQYGSSA